MRERDQQSLLSILSIQWPGIDGDGCLMENISTNKWEELGCSYSLCCTAGYRTVLDGFQLERSASGCLMKVQHSTLSGEINMLTIQ